MQSSVRNHNHQTNGGKAPCRAVQNWFTWTDPSSNSPPAMCNQPKPPWYLLFPEVWKLPGKHRIYTQIGLRDSGGGFSHPNRVDVPVIFPSPGSRGVRRSTFRHGGTTAAEVPGGFRAGAARRGHRDHHLPGCLGGVRMASWLGSQGMFYGIYNISK